MIAFTLLLPAAAMQDIFDIMDEPYITHISELPYSSGVPSVEWNKDGHIIAWIDIMGFRNLTKADGKYFINGNPAELAITQYGTKYEISGIFDSITKSCSYSQLENNLVATLTVVLKWHVMCCDKNGCWVCGRFKETKIFQDAEIAPEQYNIVTHTLNITEYNNSVNARTEITLTSSPAFINYTYNGNHINNYKMIAHVEQTTKGIYFANLTPANIWTTGTGSLRQMNDKVIIPWTANPDYQNLTIQVSNLYTIDNVSAAEATVVRDTYNFKRSFSGLYISVIMIFSVMFGTLYYTAKRSL